MNSEECNEYPWMAKVVIVSSDLTNSSVARLLLDKRNINVVDLESLDICRQNCDSTPIFAFLLDQGNISADLQRLYFQKRAELKRAGGKAVVISLGDSAHHEKMERQVLVTKSLPKPFTGEVADRILRIVDRRC